MLVEENIFYFSLLNLKYWCFTTILWKFQRKFSEKLHKQGLLKICLKVTYPIDFCIICFHFYYGEKVKRFDFLKSNENLLCIGSYNKWFYIISWQEFANLLCLCKAPSKKRFTERSWKHSWPDVKVFGVVFNSRLGLVLGLDEDWV